jgi:dTDP-6-deoxy-L-talose 4-dehydrogenase (NAD+)
MMPRRVALTGATGFFGQSVRPALERCGAEVVHYGRSPGADVRFDLHSNAYPDIAADALVHLAWQGLPAYDDPIHLRQVPQHLGFLEAAIRSGVRNISIAGTCFEYGMQEGALMESQPAVPAAQNLYAQGKDLLRREVEALCDNAGVRLKWIRVFYIYGAGARRTLYTQLLDAIGSGAASFPMSPGDQVRDFLPVEEAAAQVTEIALQKEVTGIINCCSGVGITVQQFVASIVQQHAATLRLDLGYYPYSAFEPFAFWGDTQRLQLAREAFRRECRV